MRFSLMQTNGTSGNFQPRHTIIDRGIYKTAMVFVLSWAILAAGNANIDYSPGTYTELIRSLDTYNWDKSASNQIDANKGVMRFA
ncbi:hypothetical protein DPMN_111426 [Dreissena polymorpha]|uniref:Uncharacterized protein n=1 Tax=Dreissena polymorpha TaxID=45954 RepID=A0A9D4QNT4_DREPO|nr:hypothetical protein DPMN_111426 [Dreissena polymorpha]